MSYKQQEFDIQFHTQTVRNSNRDKDIQIKFKTVIQTSSKKIEKYCKENYPTLLTHKQYSMDERAKLIEMRSYIKNNLIKNDLNYIHKYFFDRRWLDPFKFNNKFSSIEIYDTDAKMWTDTELPYLELNGIITIDLKKFFDEYIKSRFYRIEMDTKQRITSRVIKFVFSRSLPLLLTYRGHSHISKILLSIFEEYIKSRQGNNIKNEIEKHLKIKDIHLFKMNLAWKFSDTIEIDINDTIRLLKLKAKESILPIIGGFIIYDAIKGRR